MSDYRPGPGQGAARPVRLCRPRRRRLARAARRPSRWCWNTPPARPANRQFNELWKKNMDAIGMRCDFKTAKWPENLKAGRAGKLMMWGWAGLAGAPDGDRAFPAPWVTAQQVGGPTIARFKLPAFDALYDRMRQLPDGPEREALFCEAKKLRWPTCPTRCTCTASSPTWAPLGGRLPPPAFLREWWHIRRRRHLPAPPMASGAAALTPAHRSAWTRHAGPGCCCRRGRRCRAWHRRRLRRRRPTTPRKTLRIAFPVAETGFDPAKPQRPVLGTVTATSSRRLRATTTWRAR
jgi:hypothetical protein